MYKVIKQISNEILSGKIDLKPFYKNKKHHVVIVIIGVYVILIMVLAKINIISLMRRVKRDIRKNKTRKV